MYRLLAGGRFIKIQKGEEFESERNQQNQNETCPYGEEGAEHAEGDSDRKQRDPGAEKSTSSGRHSKSTERRD